MRTRWQVLKMELDALGPGVWDWLFVVMWSGIMTYTIVGGR